MAKALFASTALAAALMCYAPADAAGSGNDRPNRIRDALTRLDTNDDGDWTEGGLPSLGRVQEISGISDLKRAEVGEAAPGFNRVNAASAPSDLSTVGKSDAASNASPSGEPDVGKGASGGAPADEPDPALTDLEKANELRSPNSDPKENPNVGKKDLGPYETQTHTADQGERLAEEIEAKLWSKGHEPADLAAGIKDPIFLIEAAMSAMNADERYRKNGELQNFMRHYTIAQVNIKAHQARLDTRLAKAS